LKCRGEKRRKKIKDQNEKGGGTKGNATEAFEKALQKKEEGMG